MNKQRLLQLITRAAFALIVMFAFTASMSMAQIYVSTTGSDALDGSSPTVQSATVGPKKTIGAALLIAGDGDTIVIEAGTYAEDLDFSAAGFDGDDITVRASNRIANTVVTLQGDIIIGAAVGVSEPNITLATSGGTFVTSGAGNDLFLADGTLTLASAGVLTLRDDVLVTRTHGAVSGSNAVFFAGESNFSFANTTAAPGESITVGLEFPADLNGGVIDITQAAGSITFPGFTAGDFDASTAASVTINGDVVIEGDTDGFTNGGAGSVVVNGDLDAQADIVTSTGAGDITVNGDLDLANGVYLINDGTGDMEVTGTVRYTETVIPAELGLTNDVEIIRSDAGSLTVNNVVTAFASRNGGAAGNATFNFQINIVDGDGEIAGTITEAGSGANTFSAAVDVIDGWVELLTGAAAAAPGDGLTIASSNTVSGDITNAGTLILGAGATLTLEYDNVAGFTGGLGDINGSTGTVVINGDTPAGTVDIAGNLTINGDGGAVGLDVGGNLSLAGDGDISGVVDVDGIMNVTGNGVDFTAPNGPGLFAVRVDGTTTLSATATGGDFPDFSGGDADFNGDVIINSNTDFAGDVDVAGSLTVSNVGDFGGDLTVAGTATFDGSSVADANTITGDMNISGALSISDNSYVSGVDGAVSTFTIDDTVVSQGSAFIVGEDNTLDIQGNFTGGLLDGTDTDGDGTVALVKFSLPSGGATFSPGPNTQVADVEVDGNELTLMVVGGFEAQGNLTLQNDATLDLTDVLVSLTGTNAVVDIKTNSEIIASGNTGALEFAANVADNATTATAEGAPAAGQEIIGGGTLTNIIVNNANIAPEPVDLDASITITGQISLADGGIAIENAETLAFSGDGAGVSINVGGTSVIFNGDGSTGAVSGSYDLTYEGIAVAPFTSGDEYDATDVDDLTVTATGNTINLNSSGAVNISGDFTVATGVLADLDDDLEVDGTASIAGTVSGNGVPNVLELSGDGLSHSVTGTVTADLTLSGDSDLAGSTSNTVAATLTNVNVTGTVSISNIQQVTGLIDVDGDLTFGMSNADGATAGPGTDARLAGNLTVDEGASFTLSTNVISDANVDFGDNGATAGTATLNLGGFELRMVGGAFTADVDSDLGTTGTIAFDGGTIGTAGASVPNLWVDSGLVALSSDVDVLTLLDVDVALGLATFTLSLQGDAELAADVTGGEFETLGTTLTASADIDFTDLTINSVSTTTFASTSGTTDRTFTVLGAYVHTKGDVDLGDQDLVITTSFDYTAGSYMAGDGIVFFNDATDNAAAIPVDTNGGIVTIPNVTVDVTVGTDVGSNDGITLVDGASEVDQMVVSGSFMILDGTVLTNEAGALTDSKVTLNDGVVLTRDDGTFEQTPTFGGDNLTVIYEDFDASGLIVTDNELPATVAELQINDATELDDNVDVAVTTLDLNGDLSIDENDDGDNTLTIAEGGWLQVSALGAFVDNNAGTVERFTPAGPVNLMFDGLATTNSLVFPDAAGADAVNVNELSVQANVALHADRTVVDATIDAAFDVNGNELSVTGSFVLVDDADAPDGSITDSGPGGALALDGSGSAQTLDATGDIDFPASRLIISNPEGVILTGGDIDFRNPGAAPAAGPGTGGTLVLEEGVFTTGTNQVILDHGGTGSQGFTSDGGVLVGNVTKEIVGGALGAAADRMTFPTGTTAGESRPVSITFNKPNEIAAGGASGITLTVNHLETSPGGNNNLPLTTKDNLGEDLTIARYPDFHWLITASSTLSPSVDYDIELNAAGFAEFVGEDIESVRTIRRQAHANEATITEEQKTNFWTLVGPTPEANDNFAVSSTNPVTVVRDAVGALNSGNGVLFTMGLESNMTVTAPAAVAVNAGDTQDLDLSTVFGGGTGAYTYAITSADTGVATGTAAGNTLTVSGVAIGSTTLTVVATDELNDSRSTTVTVNVAPGFAAAPDLDLDAAVNVGGTNEAALEGVVVGGTEPYTYAATSNDTAVATAAIVSGELVITGVAIGSTTVDLVATDATGATVTLVVNVTVSNALAIASGATDVVELTEGDSGEGLATDLFEGGSSPFDIAVSSADEDHVTVSIDDAGMITINAIEAYAAGTTIGLVNVTVDVTDASGATLVITVPVDVLPVLGDLDGSGAPSSASASLALDYFLGLTTLTAKQQVAADFNSDGFVTPFDAALIFDAFFNSKKEINEFVASDLAFGTIAREAGMVSIPLVLEGDLNGVVSAQFTAQIDPAYATVTSVESNLGEGWIVKHVVSEDGQLRVAIAGFGDVVADGNVATINLQLVDGAPAFNLSAEGAVNNNPVANIDAVEVVELPETFALQGNYPNPFNPTTTVQFDLPETADVEIHVFDMVGRQVMALPSQTIQAGTKRSVQLNASQLASGSYFYRVIAKMESKTLVESGRMMLVK